MKKPPEFLINRGLKNYSQLLKMVLVLTIRSNKGDVAQEITIAVCGSALTFTDCGSFVSFVLHYPAKFHYDTAGHEVSGDFGNFPHDSPRYVDSINVRIDGTASITVRDSEEVFFEVGGRHIMVDLEIR